MSLRLRSPSLSGAESRLWAHVGDHVEEAAEGTRTSPLCARGDHPPPSGAVGGRGYVRVLASFRSRGRQLAVIALTEAGYDLLEDMDASVVRRALRS